MPRVPGLTRPPYIFSAILMVIGLALALPGIYLITLDGSWYYAIAGLLILASACYVARGRRFGSRVYGAMFVLTVFWSLWEVGLDFWALIPRLAFLGVVGLWFFTPWVRRATV